MKITKRIFSLLLAFAMLCALLPHITCKVNASATKWDVINTRGISGKDIVAQARTYLGVPYDTSGGNYKYRTGFANPMMFDCSGLVYRVCRDVGLASSRANYTMGQTDPAGNPLEGQDAAGNYYITAHTQEQRYYGQDISAAVNKYINTGDYSDLLPGDLLFITGDGSNVSHVVIYAGDGKIIHSEGYHGSVAEHPIGRYPTTNNWYFDGCRLVDNSYLGKCNTYPANCKIEVSSDTTYIKSLPCSKETDASSTDVEKAVKGDRYKAIGLVQNTAGNLWYKVEAKNGEMGYIYAGDTRYFGEMTEDIQGADISVPTNHTAGAVYVLTGTVKSSFNQLTEVSAYVYAGNSEQGARETGAAASVNGYSYDLERSTIDNQTEFNKLPVGTHTYVVTASYINYYATSATTCASNTGTKCVYKRIFNVVGADGGSGVLRPSKPSLNVYLDEQTVEFTWNPTTDTTHYNLWLLKKNNSGDWETLEQIFYAESGVSRELGPGEYCAQLLSYNSNGHEPDNSDWLHTWAEDVTFSILERNCSGTCGNNLTWALNEDGVLTISGTGAMTNWDSGGAAPWYGYADRIQSVAVENGVTSVGDFAFYGCTNLKSVSLPASVTYIGEYSFYNCWSLRQLTLPSAVKTIGQWSFYSCPFTHFKVPSGVTKINAGTFCGSTLTSIEIPESITTVGAYAFQACSNLKDVYYSGTVDLGYAIILGEKNELFYNATWHYTGCAQGNHSWRSATCTMPKNCKACGITSGSAMGHLYTNDADTSCNRCGAFAYPGGNTIYYESGKWYHVINRQKVKDTTLVNYGGKWWYIKDGVNVSATTLVNYGGTTYYVKNGTVDFTVSGFTYCAGGWYNLSGGKVVKTTTLVNYGGKWWYVKDGVWTKTTTLFKYGTTWYYVKDGIVDFGANTLVKYGGLWYNVKGGKWVKETAMISYGGTLFYVKNGTVDFTAKGFTYCAGNWYNLSGGKVVKSTTLINYGGKWWYVKDGVWTKSTTLVKYGGTWYYVKDGIVNFGANTLVKYGNSWYHVKGGKWVKDTALVGLGGTTYYVKNGTVDFTANGLTYCGGNWYNLSNGKLVKTSTLVKYGGKWWYVKSGAWTKATTLVKYGGTWYYVKNGIVDFTFNGKVPYGGKYYNVKNGKMVP